MPAPLYLVPNTLDLGEAPEHQSDIRDVLPDGVLRQAAALTHWLAEDAKTTRAFLQRVAAVHPLALPLQQIQIQELPRSAKGSARGGDAQPVIARPTGPRQSPPPPTSLHPLLTPAQQGTPLGLISEAGLPGVADPGADIVAAAHALHIPVVALSGPSSITLAVAASGLQGQSFAFVGYLPQDASARTARIRALENLSRQHQQTQLMIETPYRNAALAPALLQTLSPTTRLSISCGLTLPRGWTRTHTVAQWRQHLGEPSPSHSSETSSTAALWPDKVPTVFALLA